ncbi:class A beta-lactamase [Mycobacterium riyadhense]|uniref:Beta-lactamase n=1 Tax=Mycobacterium riyadhense TaxID=486698 RepID=A0A1X2CSR3_9MYCO|nr:class A beta-lactamase [Mycobacterium riyadhense]MCV7148354.1 class A beta-lactamase [Mycobacterium riyadhense]ORW78990.1 class A beta-lactamase [Mycobacterium riyadhense]VTO95599.1 Beta-lactamase precursor [Mycobacterium riyadhense]
MPDSPDTGFGRRELMAAALLIPLAGCARRASGDPPAVTTALARPDIAARFSELERNYEARLGVYVPAAQIAYRADERFAFCSTFKAPLVAAVLHQFPLPHLDKVITYTSDDIRSTSPVTQQHVATGMTIGQLCDAAIRYSDGTAANLLLADIGGTATFTGYLRELGDTVSRLDQVEPELNRDAPDDQRDTTTPHAIALVFQQLVLGNALPADKKAMLIDWMARNTTGAKRIRAGFPADWKVIDKTGTGDYGRANDVAVVWSPTGVANVVAIYSDRAAKGYDAEPSDGLIAEAAALVASALGG